MPRALAVLGCLLPIMVKPALGQTPASVFLGELTWAELKDEIGAWQPGQPVAR